MSEDKKAESPSIRSISLTLVDILGALVPGLAWVTIWGVLIHFLIFTDLNFTPEYILATKIFRNQSTLLQTAVIAFYTAISLILGYIVKAFAMEAAGFIESWFLSLRIIFKGYEGPSRRYPERWKRLSFRRKLTHIRKACEFPYNIFHKGKPYISRVNQIVKTHSRLSLKSLPTSGGGPFSYCKRLIRVSSPELWQESEQLEAEVRMMGSLFLASLAAFLISVVSLTVYLIKDQLSSHPLSWKTGIITLILTLVFRSAFSRRRREEVRYTYLNTLLIDSREKLKSTK